MFGSSRHDLCLSWNGSIVWIVFWVWLQSSWLGYLTCLRKWDFRWNHRLNGWMDECVFWSLKLLEGPEGSVEIDIIIRDQGHFQSIFTSFIQGLNIEMSSLSVSFTAQTSPDTVKSCEVAPWSRSVRFKIPYIRKNSWVRIKFPQDLNDKTLVLICTLNNSLTYFFIQI